MYWADRDHSRVVKRSPDGRVTTLMRAPFRDVRWMTATPAGVIYLVDYHDLIRVEPDGKFRFVARKLSSALLGGRHALMGLWTDSAGNVYIAAYADRQVKRVTPRGAVSVVQTSRFPWGPTGGASLRASLAPRQRGEGLSVGRPFERPSPRVSGERVAEGRVRGRLTGRERRSDRLSGCR
jgi:hypothetical protein